MLVLLDNNECLDKNVCLDLERLRILRCRGGAEGAQPPPLTSIIENYAKIIFKNDLFILQLQCYKCRGL